MIISRTPLRMSFVGGGTDLPLFYEKSQGAVISTAINKYVYITVNHRFDHTIRISYSQTEIVEHISDVHHDRCREVMREVGVDSGIEITSIADIPAGTGMGSSRPFAFWITFFMKRSASALFNNDLISWMVMLSRPSMII